jgi:hypothetical protein
MKPSYLLAFALSAISACTSSGPVRRTYSDDSQTKSNHESSVETSAEIPAAANATAKPDLVRKAQSEYAAGNSAAALETLKTVNSTKLKPGPRTEYWNLRGLTELGNHNTDAAEVSFKNAISANTHPEYAGYYQYNLASAYADGKKSEEAIHE